MKKALLFASVFAITVLTAVLLFVLPASAEDVVHSGTWGNLNWTLNETTGELVISGEGEICKFYDFTDAWHVHRTSIQSVKINDGVTSIGDGAFGGCKNLSSITIPDSVTSIGGSVFNGCTSLTSVTIGNSVKSIPSSVFCNCTSLESITIPCSVTSIGVNAFYNCTSLVSAKYLGTRNQWNKIMKMANGNEALFNALVIVDGNDSKKNDDDKSGCGSVVSGGLGLMALITLAGGMIVSKKKK